MNHSGTGRFRVRMVTDISEAGRPLGEGTGIWKGSTAVIIRDTGEYYFSVQGDAGWQIDVMWPTPETAPVSDAPFTHSGTGDQAIYFVLVQTGDHTLSMTHDGSGGYSAYVVTSEGRRYVDKVGGVGTTSASREFSIRDKAFEFCIVIVQATGNWTIQIE